jgi:hypothetical protein
MHLLKLVKLLLKRALHGQKKSSKGREIGDKTCMEFRLRPRKLNTLVKTRYMCILFPTSHVYCLFIFHASWFHIFLDVFDFFLTFTWLQIEYSCFKTLWYFMMQLIVYGNVELHAFSKNIGNLRVVKMLSPIVTSYVLN